MRVRGQDYRSIWVDEDGLSVVIIDQTALPHAFGTLRLQSLDDAVRAIADMLVRGAPLIGATAAYGVALAMQADDSDAALHEACERLVAARPTAVNLAWAVRLRTRMWRSTPPSATTASS
jgi:methylthioribose-1-phosphate isomerase